MDAEVRETLSRHGMSEEDIARMAEFEASVKRAKSAKRRQPKPVAETLFDF